jgi:hypothetical protein
MSVKEGNEATRLDYCDAPVDCMETVCSAEVGPLEEKSPGIEPRSEGS